MITIYEVSDIQWTGQTLDIDNADQGIPAGWTDIEPPAVGVDQAAYYVAGSWVVGMVQAPRTIVPDEVAIHRVKKAALLTAWPGFDSLLDAIYGAIDQLPAPSNKLAKIEFDSAPNLVRVGLTTVAVCGLLGMTVEQLNELLVFAATLP